MIPGTVRLPVITYSDRDLVDPLVHVTTRRLLTKATDRPLATPTGQAIGRTAA